MEVSDTVKQFLREMMLNPEMRVILVKKAASSEKFLETLLKIATESKADLPAGTVTNTYLTQIVNQLQQLPPEALEVYAATGELPAHVLKALPGGKK